MLNNASIILRFISSGRFLNFDTDRPGFAHTTQKLSFLVGHSIRALHDPKTYVVPVATLHRRYDIDLRDDRELALQRLTKFCQAGFVSVTDFRYCTTFQSFLPIFTWVCHSFPLQWLPDTEHKRYDSCSHLDECQECMHHILHLLGMSSFTKQNVICRSL